MCADFKISVVIPNAIY